MSTTPIRELGAATRVVLAAPSQYTVNSNIYPNARTSLNHSTAANSQATAHVSRAIFPSGRPQPQQVPQRYAPPSSGEAPSYKPAVVRTANVIPERPQQAQTSAAVFGGARYVAREESVRTLAPEVYPTVMPLRKPDMATVLTAPTVASTVGTMPPSSPTQHGRRLVTLQAETKMVPQEFLATKTDAVRSSGSIDKDSASKDQKLIARFRETEASMQAEITSLRAQLEAKAECQETQATQSQQLRAEVQSLRMRLEAKDSQAVSADQLVAEVQFLKNQLESKETQASQAQAMTIELSYARSRTAELETQLKEAVARQSEAEAKAAREAVVNANLSQQLGALTMNASEASSSEQLLAEVQSLRAQLEASEVQARASQQLEAEVQSLRAQLEATRLQAVSSVPLSPSRASPTKNVELERVQARCDDMNAMLIDAREDRKRLEATLAVKEKLVAELQQEVHRAREEARFMPEPTSPGGKKRIMDKVLDWLPNLHTSRHSYRRHSNADSAALLFEAAEKNDVSAVQVALTSFPESSDPVDLVLHTRNEQKQTLLHVALASGALEVARFILEQGQLYANQRKYYFELIGELLEREATGFVNSLDFEGRSPLATLCTIKKDAEKADFDIAAALMESNANPVQRDYNGCTPFLECIRSGNTGLMGMLLKVTGGEVMYDADNINQVALHYGAAAGQKKAVELLLKVEANVEEADINGKTAMQMAEEAGHEEVVKLLLDGVKDSDDEDEEEGKEDGGEEAGKKKKVGVKFTGADGDDAEEESGDDDYKFLKKAYDEGMKRPEMPMGDAIPPDEEDMEANPEQAAFFMGQGINGLSRVAPGGNLRPAGRFADSPGDMNADEDVGEGIDPEMLAEMMGQVVMTPEGPCLVTPEGLIRVDADDMGGMMLGPDDEMTGQDDMQAQMQAMMMMMGGMPGEQLPPGGFPGMGMMGPGGQFPPGAMMMGPNGPMMMSDPMDR